MLYFKKALGNDICDVFPYFKGDFLTIHTLVVSFLSLSKKHEIQRLTINHNILQKTYL